MDGQKPKAPDWVRRLKAELKRDRKKAVLLFALLAVGFVIVARQLMQDQRSGRRGAVRSAAANSSEQPDQQDPGRTERLRLRYDQVRQAERQKYIAEMDRGITRDLFSPNPEFFPAPYSGTDPKVTIIDPQAEGGWFGGIGGWIRQKQQARREEVARVAIIRAQAQALSLQSTMLGPSPTALVNGQVLRQGEVIQGFRLQRVDSDSCVVSKDGVDVLLRMKD